MLDTRKDLNFTSFNIEKSFAKNTNGIYSKFPYNKIRTYDDDTLYDALLFCWQVTV